MRPRHDTPGVPVETATEPFLSTLVARLTASVCGAAVVVADCHFGDYARRLEECLAYHAARFAEAGDRLATRRLIARLERGELGGARLKGNVPREVVLAQALELGVPRAAEVFEDEFMPVVRGIARGLGGPRALDSVENFAADLILPREGRGPKIATFRGRTTLAQWLGPVVANSWRTQGRRRPPEALTLLDEPVAGDDPGHGVEERQCEGLLRPIFLESCRALEPEDRLLLQMLVLDGVPQKDLARALGLNSGTITRRRQRAAGLLLDRTRRLVAVSRHAGDCLGSMLAGDDPGLCRRLAEVLAEGVRHTEVN